MNYPTVYSSLQGCPLELVGKTGQAVQISIHSPSPYICANREQILPDWLQPDFWVAIVLQQARCQLVETSPEVEGEKQSLREKFMRFGCDVAFNLRDQGYPTDLIDPRTGYPLLSRPGKIPHDDTAVIKALLDYPLLQNQCRVLVHPDWGMAVYPSILISSAMPETMELCLKNIATIHGWKDIA